MRILLFFNVLKFYWHFLVLSVILRLLIARGSWLVQMVSNKCSIQNKQGSISSAYQNSMLSASLAAAEICSSSWTTRSERAATAPDSTITCIFS
jgi:hypothetical protein